MKNKTFRFILIALLVAIDVWFYHAVSAETPRNGGALFLAFVSHFGVAIYYYQRHEKSSWVDRPYQSYAYLGFFLPWLAVGICENVSTKYKEKVDLWVDGSIFIALLIFLISAFVFF